MIMRLYDKVAEGRFVSRPNRFVAYVEIDGVVSKCHVKNTGRCKELLVPGATVFLSKSDNPARSTRYDVVAVMKGDLLINMDSQAPNPVAVEGLRRIPQFRDVTEIRQEFVYGDSRIDIMATSHNERFLIEVKGVTLEHDGVARFPDAPTERGRKHLRELMHAVEDGWQAYVLFVVQMEGMKVFEPNEATDPEFASVLREAYRAGVGVLAHGCKVTKDSMALDHEIPIRL